MTKRSLSELDRVRVAFAVAFVTLAALVLIAAALPEGWGLLLFFPALVAVPLLGAEAYKCLGRNGGDR